MSSTSQAARLPDAARVHEPLARAEVERRASRTRLARGRRARLAHERQCDVGVADQAHPLGLGVEAQLGQQRREDVLPHGVPGAGVIEAETVVQLLGLELVEIGEVLVGQSLLGPARRQFGAAGELVERYVAAHGEVVVAGQAHIGALGGQLAARVGLAAVADDVAQAPDPVHAFVVDRGEHGLQGRPIAVDVRDDGDAHGERG